MSKTDDLCKRSYIGPDGMIHVRPKRKAWRPKYVRTVSHKVCEACGVDKDRECFLKHKLGVGGLEGRCMTCKYVTHAPKKAIYAPKAITHKICNVCSERREVKYFEKWKSANDGREKTCMFCKVKQGKIVSGVRKKT